MGMAQLWLLSERELDWLVIAVSENSLYSEFREDYPLLFDESHPMNAEFVEKYERCLDIHMSGFGLQAPDFFQEVREARECYSKLVDASKQKPVSDTNTDVEPDGSG